MELQGLPADMDATSEALWFPTVGGYVLATAALVTVATLFVQFRRFGTGVHRWWRGGEGKSGAPLLLCGSASMGSITGAALAVTLGGPGALPWMWIATILGMALHFAEASLTATHRTAQPRPFPSAAGSFGGVLAVLFSVGVIVVAIVAGGLFQTQQAAVVLEETADLDPMAAAILVGLLGAAVAFVPKARRAAILYMVPMAVALVITLGATAAFSDPLLLSMRLGDALNEAFGLQSAATGTTAGAVGLLVFHGVQRAVMGGEIGLGAAAMAEAEDGTAPTAGPTAMLVPFIANGLVGTATALALLADPAASVAISEPTLRPLERHESKGLRPNTKLGQVIVLPDDTTLQAEKFYAMRLRSSPRGHALSRLVPDKNAIAIPTFAVAQHVDTVVFRSKNKKRAKQPGWDVRVPVNAEEITDGTNKIFKLTPKDPAVDFAKLASYYELEMQPHVVVDDFQFIGHVGRATAAEEAGGEHLAMYEPEPPDRPFNPKLHEFFRAGFRGPYADTDDPRPPWGLVAVPGLQAEIGDRLRVVLRGDPRGNDFITLNRAGGAEGPLWAFLLDSTELVMRHASDSTKDIRIPVKAQHDEWRIRFESSDPTWVDFRKAGKDYTGPYVMVSDVEFDVEVHGDARLPADRKGRLSLVPLHEHAEPMGPVDGPQPYAPHPGELLDAGMAGPFLSGEGVQQFSSRVRYSTPTWGPWMLVFVVVVLAASTIGVWSVYAARSARHLAGDGAGKVASVVVIAASLGGGAIAFSTLLPWVELAYVVAIVPNLAAIVLMMSEVRVAAGTREAAPSSAPSHKADDDDDTDS
jgi:Na+/alanine symporter